MHKGQARFQDDRYKYFTGWCGACWFKVEHRRYDSFLSDDEIIASLKREHRMQKATTEMCGADPKIKKLEQVTWK